MNGGGRLYGGAGNLLILFLFVKVICGAGYSLENTIILCIIVSKLSSNNYTVFY